MDGVREFLRVYVSVAGDESRAVLLSTGDSSKNRVCLVEKRMTGGERFLSENNFEKIIQGTKPKNAFLFGPRALNSVLPCTSQ